MSNYNKKEIELNEYIGLEIGNSAYTEFLMQSGEFEITEDCILVGRVLAQTKEDAYKRILKLEYNINRKFHNLIIEQIVR